MIMGGSGERECLVVVGGRADHFRRMSKKIEERGFDAVHWETLSENKQSLPANAAAVLVCHDISTKPMQDQALRLAKRFGTPVLYGSAFSWTPFAGQLNARNIISKTPLEKLIEMGADAMENKMNTQEDKMTVKHVPQAKEPEVAEPVMNTEGTPAPRPGTPRNTVSHALRDSYTCVVRETLTANRDASNKELNAALARWFKKEFPLAQVPKAFSDKMYTDVRAELGIKANYGRRREPTMDEKREAVSRLPLLEFKTTSLPPTQPMNSQLQAAANYSHEVLNRGDSVFQQRLAKGADAFKLPAWYTQDFQDALALLRGEMEKAGVRSITSLDAVSFEFERVEIVRGRL